MIEREIRGYIQKESFDDVVSKLTKKFNKPVYRERISLVLGDFKDYDVEIRVRVKGGKQEIVYKLGDQNALDRKEIASVVDSDAENFVNLFDSFKYLALRSFHEPYLLGIQHANYYFYTDVFEIKLFKQFNDEDFFYGFEVEQTGEDKQDIFKFTENIGLEYDPDYNTREVVKVRNKKYNIDLTSYPREKLIKLVNKYLNNETK